MFVRSSRWGFALVLLSVSVALPLFGDGNGRRSLQIKSEEQLIREALEKGEIPPALMEDWRVVPQDHPDAKQFQKTMERIAARLYGQDMKKQPVRFLLLADDAVEAFTHRSANPPIIAMSRGLLARLTSEDQLAWVLGHEWTHGQFSRRFGSRLRNSKIEELAADAIPLRYMHEANYDPREAGKAAEAILLQKPTRSELWSKILDVHPLDRNRTAVVDATTAGIDREVGGFGQLVATPLEPEFAAVVTTRGHVSYIDKKLAEGDFASKSALDQLAILERIIADTSPWNDRRILEVEAALRKLKIADPKDAAFVERRDSLANLLLDKLKSYSNDTAKEPQSRAMSRFYSALSALAFPDNKRPGARAMGRLAPLAAALQRFRDATDADTADAEATKFLARLEKLDVSHDFLRDHVALAQFAYPEDPENVPRARRQRIVVAWNDHVDWAESPNGKNTLRTLLLMGVFDERILRAIDTQTATLMGEERFSVISNGPASGSQNIDHLKIREDGTVKSIEEPGTSDTRRRHILDQLVADRLRAVAAELFPLAIKGDKAARARLESMAPRLAFRGSLVGLEYLEKDPDLFDRLNAHLREPFTPGKDDLALRAALANHLEKLLKGSDLRARAAAVRYLGFETLKERQYFSWDSHRHAIADPMFQLVTANPGGHLNRVGVHEALANILISDAPAVTSYRRKYLQYEAPKTAAELMALAERFSKGTLAEQHAVSQEAEEFLKAAKPGRIAGFDPIRFTQLLRQPTQRRAAQAKEPVSPYELSSEVRALIAPRIAAVPASGWPADPFARAQLWQDLRSAGVLPVDDSTEREQLENILAASEKITDATERIELLERVLFGPSIRYPDLRNRAHRNWADAMLAVHGTDDGTTGYRQRIHSTIQRLVESTPRSDRSEMLSLIGTRLLAQRVLSQQLRNATKKTERKELEQSNAWGIGAEAFQVIAAKDPQLRQLFLDYLLSDRSPAKEDALFEHLKPFVYLFSKEFEVRDTNRSDKFQERRLRADLVATFENFWASPLTGRALFLERVVLPDALKDPSKSFGQSFDFVANQLFPEQSRYSKESRAFLRAYYEVLPDYQKRILLSVLLGAVRSSKQAGETSIGERLAYVLEMMGPAETKVGQAIHSHPSTPDDIRAGMPRLKGQAAPPERWELMDLYFDQVPANDRRRVKRLGRILGSASYYVVVEAEMQDGTKQVLALLRSHAKERSERGFELLEAMTGRLGLDISEETLSVVRELLGQSRASAAVETDSRMTHRQFELAAPLYRGRGFSVDGEEFRFHLPRTLRSGPGFRFMELAPGEHFNDLPEKTEAERLHKRRIAKGYLSFELALMLQGSVFDHDRHGAQMRVVGNDIYLFDWGGMALDAPTPADRKQLGEVFAEVAPRLARGEGIGAVLFEQIRLRRARGESVDYLARVQKGLLALNDFQRYLEPSDFAEVIRAAATSGIHPEIQQAATAALLSRSDFGALMQLATVFQAKSDANCLQILPALSF